MAVDPVATLKNVLLPELNRLRMNRQVFVNQNWFGHDSIPRSYMKPGFDRLDLYVRGIQDDPYKPRHSREGYKTLMDRSKLNMLDLVVNYRAQNLKIEGYKNTGDPEADNSPSWDKYWQANKMDRRQFQLWRTVFTFGVAYAVPTKGVDQLTKEPVINIGLYTPREFVAVYDDPIEDSWPVAAMRYRLMPKAAEDRDDVYEATIWDDENVYVLYGNDQKWTVASVAVHGAPVCPVVRFVDEMDLEGRIMGEVEPLMRLQDRLNQATFDLISSESFSAFRVRYITGVMFGDPDEDIDAARAEARRAKMEIAQDTVLAFPDPDTKVGDLAESDLNQLLQVVQEHVRMFAIKSQTPPQNFLGDVGGNISADALSGLQQSSDAKTKDKQKTLGEDIETLLRLCAIIDGDTAAAKDTSSQVIWGDTEARSLAQIADAYTKLGTSLMIPVEELWSRIPGVTQQDVDRWKLAKKKADAAALAEKLLVNPGVNDIVQPTQPGAAQSAAGSPARQSPGSALSQPKPPVGPGRPAGS